MWYQDSKTFVRNFIVDSENYTVRFTGGSIIISDRKTGNVLKCISGFSYLYTGGLSPDESQFFALENGKHFYVYSLKDFNLIKRITLPRGFEAIDVTGFYSEDGTGIIIPASRYVYDGKTRMIQSNMLYEPIEEKTGYYEYVLCKYCSENLTLSEKEPIADYEEFRKYGWKF